MRERNHSIDILRFFAALLITNSHMQILYHPYDFLSTGGAIGDALFFFCSGFTIFLGRKDRFDNWYKRRINRIYPTVFAWALISSIFFGIHRDMKSILLFGGGWFVSCIMIYYVFLWLIHKYLYQKMWAAIGMVVIFVMIWYNYEDKSTIFMYQSQYFKWSFFFLYMLFGALIGTAFIRVKPFQKNDLFFLVLSTIIFYGILFVGTKITVVAKVQILSLIPLLGIIFYFYKLCTSMYILKLYRIKWIYNIVFFVSSLCLEIYLVQFSLFTDKMNKLFPLNILLMFIIVIVAAFGVKILSRIFSQTFSKEDYSWKQIFSVYPNVTNIEVFQNQGVKGEAVRGYYEPLATADLEPSGFPKG